MNDFDDANEGTAVNPNSPKPLSHEALKSQQKFKRVLESPIIPIYQFVLSALFNFEENNHSHALLPNPPNLQLPNPPAQALINIISQPGQLFENSTIPHQAEAFLKLLKNSLIPQKVKSMAQEYKENQIPLKELAKFSCKTCRRYDVQVKLECKHKVCATCFHLSVSELMKKPSLEGLKRCKCRFCGILYTDKDVGKIFDKNEVKRFRETKIFKTCAWCKRERNAFSEFLTELDCMHLCRECYVSELYMGVRKCMACEIGFDNWAVTMNRKAICGLCNAEGKIVENWFRAVHKDHFLCYNCISGNFDEMRVQKKCKLCSEDLISSDLSALYYYFQQKCPFCGIFKAICDITSCKICLVIICDDCSASHTCNCSKRIIN